MNGDVENLRERAKAWLSGLKPNGVIVEDLVLDRAQVRMDVVAVWESTMIGMSVMGDLPAITRATQCMDQVWVMQSGESRGFSGRLPQSVGVLRATGTEIQVRFPGLSNMVDPRALARIHTADELEVMLRGAGLLSSALGEGVEGADRLQALEGAAVEHFCRRELRRATWVMLLGRVRAASWLKSQLRPENPGAIKVDIARAAG